MKYFSWLFLALFAAACAQPNEQSNTTAEPEPAIEVAPGAPKGEGIVIAALETESVEADVEDDAADDPALWYDAGQPELSLIIGSNKTRGLDVYSLSGKRLASYNVGPINNVDVRQGWLGEYDLVGGSHRVKIGMDFWLVNKNTRELEFLGSIASNLEDVYGFCLYKDPSTNEVHAFVNSKTGKVEQWMLTMDNGSMGGTLVRELQLQSQVEGMVADDELGVIYVGVEEGGIYKFGVGAGDSPKGTLVLNSNQDNLAIQYDVEGLTIYSTGPSSGYLIASSQGNNTYAVFDRSGQNEYLGSFEIKDGVVDGVQETDGIHATSLPLGSEFPMGVFMCQDGFNFDGETKVSQNFKVVDWRMISDWME